MTQLGLSGDKRACPLALLLLSRLVTLTPYNVRLHISEGVGEGGNENGGGRDTMRRGIKECRVYLNLWVQLLQYPQLGGGGQGER